MKDTETEFHDKTGRSIYIGDIVQYRLHGKNSNPLNYRVIRFGKHVNIVPVHITDPDIGGWHLTHTMTEYIVVIQTDFIRG
jgi:hypothetical protein